MIWGIVSSVVGPQAPVMFLLITCVTLYLINYLFISYVGEGNGNRLQYSCLENPMDREAW